MTADRRLLPGAPSPQCDIGIAVGADGVVVAAWPAGGSAPETSRAGYDTPTGGGFDAHSVTAAIARAITQLPRDLVGRRARVSIALMPPLYELRLIPMPPMAPADARRVLARDVSRWFRRTENEVEIAVRQAGPAGASGVIAVAADRLTLEQVISAVQGAGLSPADVVAAPVAWATLAQQHARGDVRTLICVGTDLTALSLREGRVAGLRRARLADVTRIADVIRSENDRTEQSRELLALLGPTERSAAVCDELHRLRVTIAPTRLDACMDLAEAAAIGAPVGARMDPKLCIVPEHIRLQSAARTRRMAAALWGAAACALVAAGILNWWGTARELAHVSEARAALAPAVERAMAARDSIDRLLMPAATLDAELGQRTSWSQVVARLAHELPVDASITSLRADGDSVVIEGEAVHAADVVQSLRNSPDFIQVRPAGPYRQVAGTDGEVSERFSAIVRVRRAPEPRR